MYKTFSLRPLSIRYTLSLLVLPIFLWTCMLTGMHGQAHAAGISRGVTFSVFATDPVARASFRVIFPGALPASVCQSFTPNQWSPTSAGNVQNITRIDTLELFPDSADCNPKFDEKTGFAKGFSTALNLNASQLSGQNCTFDYRSDTLSGCVNQPIHIPTKATNFSKGSSKGRAPGSGRPRS